MSWFDIDKPTADWSDWKPWGECSGICNQSGSYYTRERDCQADNGHICVGLSIEHDVCKCKGTLINFVYKTCSVLLSIICSLFVSIYIVDDEQF